MNEDQIFYSTDDVARRYDVTRRTVQKWIHKGLLPGAEKKSPLPKSDWLIPESAIEHFEEQRKAASQPNP